MEEFTKKDLDEISKKIRKRRRRWSDDKILDNSFNKGDLDTIPLKKISVDSAKCSLMGQTYSNSHSTYRENNLNVHIHEIYMTSDYHKVYDIKTKIPKHELCEIYCFLFERLYDDTYTKADIFVAIADYLAVNYKVLYEMVPNAHKISLLQELNKEYKKINNENVVRLF